ncbi:glycosyltransferase family 4 protein [Paenibacillus doosanensis]|uniref:Spore coat protein SA n=1 Tax=Paenibacillus konkukensis TaxID=2020716 RepID=A0ABY4RY61_9BACL|nr:MULTISPECIES: glycosyltransferase family 4 protein [Paenibacillus]MCS7458865.1 glycosyltransferase family 4 protein [Paenibacillus doosanensis]UQZ86606.1 Spore coat protein SA [Paenibacillus konkukensis]
MERPVIAIVSPGSFVIPSATSSSVELVIEQVAKRMTARVSPVVFGRMSGIRPKLENVGGVRYVRVPAPTPSAYIRHVSRKLFEYKPQIIQVENRPRFVRYLRRHHPKAQIWLVLHSLTFVSGRHIGRAELQDCLAAADRIVVNSSYLMERLKRMAPSISGNIVVNHLGVDTEKFTSRWTEEGAARRERMLRSMGLSGKKIILYVGRLIEIKGVHHLLRAMPRIAKLVPDAVLLVVGGAFYGSKRTTPYVRRLHRMGAKMKKRVRFIPYVPHNQIASWFGLADILVVPSNSREAFGLVNVEAMASGVPVAATRVGGMKEIIEHGVTGYLIDAPLLGKELPQWVSTVLTRQELAKQLGEESLRKVREQFTWECTARRWMELYGLY